jgi:hypothetical protein
VSDQPLTRMCVDSNCASSLTHELCGGGGCREEKILPLLLQVFILLAKSAPAANGGVHSFALAAVLQNVPSSYIARYPSPMQDRF